MRPILVTLALALVCSCSDKTQTHAADNTARNARDKSGNTVTPTDQSGTATDLALTQKIRQALMDDSALSTNAKNIKVVTQSGKVTLRGVVDSQTEKDSVEAKAKAVAGVLECDDQLEVKTK